MSNNALTKTTHDKNHGKEVGMMSNRLTDRLEAFFIWANRCHGNQMIKHNARWQRILTATHQH
jgi:hypothetical protein